MQPSSGSPQYPPPSPGYAAANEPAGRPPFAPPQAEAAIVRVRAWLVGIVAGLTMLVLIAAVANQSVSEQVVKHFNNSRNFADDFFYSTTTYSWRFSPVLSSDVGHLWLAGLVFDVLVVVLTLLITTALAKNKRGFGGTFLAAWVGVFVATQLSGYVRGAIVDVNLLRQENLSKPVTIFFSDYSAGQFSMFAGLVFGLVVALVTGAVGAASRRTEVLALPAPVFVPGPPTEEPSVRENQQPWTAPPAPVSSSSPWTESRVDTTARDDSPQPTAVLPVVGGAERRDETPADSQATTQFPAWPRDEPTGEPRPAGRESESTQAYRVPIDDDGEPGATDAADATQAYRLPPREDER